MLLQHDTVSIYRYILSACPTSGTYVVGRKKLTAVFQAGDREPAPLQCIFLHFSRIQARITRPRNGGSTPEGKFRRPLHRIENQNCSHSSFRYRTVARPTLHSNLIVSVIESSREPLPPPKKTLPGTRHKRGYRGTRWAKWHYPMGRVGSGLQKIEGTRRVLPLMVSNTTVLP